MTRRRRWPGCAGAASCSSTRRAPGPRRGPRSTAAGPARRPRHEPPPWPARSCRPRPAPRSAAASPARRRGRTWSPSPGRRGSRRPPAGRRHPEGRRTRWSPREHRRCPRCPAVPSRSWTLRLPFIDRPPLRLLFFRLADALGGLLAGRRGATWSAPVGAALVSNPVLCALEINAELLGVFVSAARPATSRPSPRAASAPARGAPPRSGRPRPRWAGSGRCARRRPGRSVRSSPGHRPGPA